MRYKEIASLPSTPEEAQNAILDLVTVYRSKDAASIPMTRSRIAFWILLQSIEARMQLVYL